MAARGLRDVRPAHGRGRQRLPALRDARRRRSAARRPRRRPSRSTSAWIPGERRRRPRSAAPLRRCPRHRPQLPHRCRAGPACACAHAVARPAPASSPPTTARRAATPSAPRLQPKRPPTPTSAKPAMASTQDMAAHNLDAPQAPIVKADHEKIGRNDPCHCGSRPQVQALPRSLKPRYEGLLG